MLREEIHRTTATVASLAGVAQWQCSSLPSWLRGSDSRHPLCCSAVIPPGHGPQLVTSRTAHGSHRFLSFLDFLRPGCGPRALDYFRHSMPSNSANTASCILSVDLRRSTLVMSRRGEVVLDRLLYLLLVHLNPSPVVRWNGRSMTSGCRLGTAGPHKGRDLDMCER